MEKTFGFIKQDPLAIAILEIKEEKRLGRQKETKTLTEFVTTKFLVGKIGEKGWSVFPSLDRGNKLKIYKKCLKSLIFGRACLYLMSLLAFPTFSVATFWENNPLASVVAWLGTTAICSSYILLRTGEGVLSLSFRKFVMAARGLRQNITTLERELRELNSG